VFLLFATSEHLGLFAGLIAFGFLLGVFGHLAKSRPVILLSIILIAAISLYFVIHGEANT
jgi:hypothetical protein